MFQPRKSDIDITRLDFSKSVAEFNAAMSAALNGSLQMPPLMDPVEWIAANIELTKQESSRPGPLKLTVYQRAAAQAMVDPAVVQINILKGVQVGYSRFLSAMIAYFLVYESSKVMLAQPTDGDAKGYFKDTIEPRFRDVASLRAIIRNPGRGEQQDTWDEHRFKNGAILYMRGAASDDSFRRVSSRINLADEVDADAWQSGDADNQGSKLELFRDRGTDFWDSKLVVGSTPLKRETSIVWSEYAKSDQRKLHVHCPHCGGQQVLKWGGEKEDYGFKWETDSKGNVSDCWYQCEVSGCRIDEYDKEEMIDAGEFIPTAAPNRPGNVGLHWPAWLSSAPKAAWKNLAQRWLNAQGKPEELQTFVNNVLAEPWDELLGGGMEAAEMHELATPYPAEVPDDVVVLTGSSDNQTNKEGSEYEIIASREVSVIGWNKDKMPRVIGHWIVEGEPGTADADARVDEVLQRPYMKRDGTKLFVQASAHDMGGHYGDAVKAYCNARHRSRVWAIKGKNTALGKRSQSVWPRKVSKAKKGAGGQWFMIDTQLAKDFIGRRLKVRGAGGPMFPASLPPEYFDGLVAEKYVYDKKKGGGYWKRTGKNTGEAWDCLIYAYAALCGLQASTRAYRDLYLASKHAGIEEVPHDPETGEVLEPAPYIGDDKSVQASERPDGAEVSSTAAITGSTKTKARAKPSREQKVNNEALAPAPTPGATPTKPKRKRRSGGVIRGRW